MKRSLRYTLLLFTISVCSTYAQELLTLKQCLETGLKNSPELQLKQLDIVSASYTYRSAAMEYLPVVSVSGTHTYNIGSVIDPATNNRVSSQIQSDNIGLNATMNLLDFNVFTNARRNKILELKAVFDKNATEAEYTLTLIDSYINAIYTQELLKIQLNQFENARFNMDRVSKEVSLGSRPQSDYYDMQMSFSQEESSILQTKQLLYNQKLLLLQLINDTAHQPGGIVLQHSMATTPLEETDVQPILEKALSTAPAVKSAALELQVSKKSVTAARNNYLPVISAFYSYSSFYYLPLNQVGNAGVNPFFTQLNDNKNHYVGAQVSIPVFNGLKSHRSVQLAKVEEQKSTVRLEQEKIKLRQALEQEKAKQQQNNDLAQKLEEAKSYAEKSFITTQAKFSSGLVDAIVYTTSKNQLLNAEYNLLKANVTATYAGVKLHFLQFNSLP